ncbi:hydroxysteroid 11-beta-dehydrogenase 1-like protein [Anolis carolinensis]|uniref:hydroxysteroid 11-beta-dehydrogenase 1-like protein n=1 Tax=Anolis carolinensis TaxID=28377 RepID=UPI002F2B572C
MRAAGLLLSVIGIVAIWVASWRDTFEPRAQVLLTGARDGIGEQMAYHYAQFGVQIVLTARRKVMLQKVMAKCLELGAKKAIYFVADMASPAEPEKLIRFTSEQFGGLDFVVLNHIGTSSFEIWAGDMDHLRWLMQHPEYPQ